MVDVGEKPKIARMAIAQGEIRIKPATVLAIKEGRIRKGDPLAVAEIAGIL
ncbi:MAG: cyclic pyranopterin monophosphate synthase MoaC, partial [Desulfatiglandales bacterium]